MSSLSVVIDLCGILCMALSWLRGRSPYFSNAAGRCRPTCTFCRVSYSRQGKSVLFSPTCCGFFSL
jgi:hypothetical protein